MKKPLRMLALLAMLCIPWVTQAQETLTLYDGETATNTYVPVHGLWADAYLKAHFVYPADDMAEMTGGTISQLDFYATSAPTAAWSGTFHVYVGEVSYTTIDAYEDVTTLTEVYVGSLDATSGTMSVVFDNDYTYNGGNLLIAVQQEEKANYKGVTWAGKSVSGASVQGYNSSSLAGVSANQRNFLPKVTFTYDPPAGGCDMPATIAVSNITPDGATITWTGSGDTWAIRYKGPADADWNLVDGLTDQTYTFDYLDENTTYQVGVQTVCTGGESSFRGTSFTTINTCGAPTNLVVDNLDVTSATLSWTANYDETYWLVRYKKSTADTYEEEDVYDNPEIDLSGLDPLSTYQVRIYNCTNDLDADPYLAGTFTTLAGIPINEMFSAGSLPTGWVKYTGLLDEVMNGTTNLATGGNWTFGSANGVFDNHAKLNIYGTSCKHWLATPTITMEDNVQLTFDLALTGYYNELTAVDPALQSDDKFAVLVGIKTGPELSDIVWNVERQWDNQGSADVYNEIACSAVGQNIAIDLSAYAGEDVVIAFYGESTNLTGVENTGGDNELHIDNVSINYIPNCPAPTGLNFTDVTAHTATLHWTSEATEFQVAYKVSGTDAFTTEDVNTSTYELTGLAGETTYKVKMRANCSGAWSDWTNEATVTTAVACPAPTLAIPAAATITGHTALLSWTENGSANEYVVTYKLATDEDFIDEEMVSGATEFTLTGLDPETQYNVKVKAVCGGIDGESQWSTVRNFTTTVACPAPTGLAATLTPGDGSVATLTWNAGEATDWVLDYGIDENFGDGTYTTENVSGTASIDLSGLTPETHYYARVKADCGSDGESDYSAVYSFFPTDAYSITVNEGTATNNYVPVYGNWVDNYSRSQFIIPAADLASIQYGYINQLAFYSSNESKNWGAAEFKVYMYEVNETTLSSLADWTTMEQVYEGSLSISDYEMVITFDDNYQYMGGNLLIGINQSVSGTYSACSWYGVEATGASFGGYGNSVSQKNFLPKTTIYYIPGSAPACPKPTNLIVNYTGGDEAEVSWDSEATTWEIDVDGTVTEIDENPYTLYGLDLGTSYGVKVRAVCSGAYSDWTTPVTFTTDLCMPTDQCDLTFVLTDSYGDGWNGNAIRVTDVLTGIVIADMANQNLDGVNGEETQTVTLPVCDGRNIEFSWVSGSFATETSYIVKDANDDEIFSGSGAMSAPVNHTVSCAVVACKKPKNLDASTVTANSATIEWTGTATSYNVRVRPVIGFEKGMGDWTTIDADGDGYDWMLGSAASTVYLNNQGNLFGAGHNGSDELVTSGSYSNALYAETGDGALTPDNYLVSPLVTLGGEISFWACAQDAAYPNEYFGVAVSTTVNDDPAAFTMVPAAEWTLEADGTGTKQGIWGQFTVDLSAYAGETGYVAIRHFNCTDMFLLDIDDIVITEPGVDSWIEETNTDQLTLDLTGLQGSTAYEFQVQGVCGSEVSAWAVSTFTTDKVATLSIDADKWYAISSPVHNSANGETLEGVTNLTYGVYDLLRYNEELGMWESQKTHADFTTLEPGRGYIYRRAGSTVLTFSDAVNTGIVDAPATELCADDNIKGLNLVGNPYSHIYTLADMCYYLYDNGVWYANPSDYDMAVGEAVLVNSGTLQFNEGITKGASVENTQLVFNVTNGQYTDVAYAIFAEGKGLRKVSHLNAEAPMLSINNYAVAMMDESTESFPMAFTGRGEYKLTLSGNVESFGYLHLIDRATGADIDLLNTREYTFNGNASADRFTVLLSPEASSSIFAYVNGDHLVIEGTGDLQVFDVMGRQLSSARIDGNASLNRHDLGLGHSGVYVLRLGEQSQKIVVK